MNARLNIGAALLVVVIAALALVGCAGKPEPVTITEYVEVEVPVAVQPIAPEDVPDKPEPLGPRPETGADLMLAAWACDLWAYVLRADPLLMVSSGQAPRAIEGAPICGD